MSVHRGIQSEVFGDLMTQQGAFAELVGALGNEKGRRGGKSLKTLGTVNSL